MAGELVFHTASEKKCNTTKNDREEHADLSPRWWDFRELPRDHVGSDSMFRSLGKIVEREQGLGQYIEQSNEFQDFPLSRGDLSLSHGQ